jgi:hypothetical protein
LQQFEGGIHGGEFLRRFAGTRGRRTRTGASSEAFEKKCRL